MKDLYLLNYFDKVEVACLFKIIEKYSKEKICYGFLNDLKQELILSLLKVKNKSLNRKKKKLVYLYLQAMANRFVCKNCSMISIPQSKKLTDINKFHLDNCYIPKDETFDFEKFYKVVDSKDYYYYDYLLIRKIMRNVLTFKEYINLINYYGLDGAKPKTSKEIAKLEGITPSGIRERRISSIKKVQKYLRERMQNIHNEY